ncbi:hypothetical protein PHA77_18710 (plasmid) [Edwardsiella tarda]|uniref:hypothetical protein n=1 Tax=Edwardsiella tarda TaxID=636 RepID=UPI002444481E|nr:hypothetical protein [Edwardsiella tarda]WGE31049.1 hypothetical protein PHA77_18710 [Edwardsiella tarda]
MKKLTISLDTLAALLNIKPGELYYASKIGFLYGIKIPERNKKGKYNLLESIEFKNKIEAIELKNK